uniref:Uncharacterized protein n=1 Tax=Octopus bimaculoides TaxID=37653 RepID=A0A0L8I6K4_OCTBM
MPNSTRTTPVSLSTSEAETESEYQESEKSDEDSTQTRRKYSKSGTATKIVIFSKLSTQKTATVCRQLSQDGINVETLPNLVFTDRLSKKLLN